MVLRMLTGPHVTGSTPSWCIIRDGGHVVSIKNGFGLVLAVALCTVGETHAF